ncbi:MAG: hypothetical protein MJB14_06850 [Spirochaetes bacterium]|nr:hypothetical protein [Spirochaetota bacterium]
MKTAFSKFRLSLILLSLFFSLYCCKASEDSITYQGQVYQEGDAIIVSGNLALIGNEPFSRLVLIDEEGTRFGIPKKYHRKVSKYRGKKIQIIGKIKFDILITAKEKNRIIIQNIIPKKIKIQK